GYVYQWDDDPGFWDTDFTGSDYNDHIQVNNGHSGIKLACDKDEIGFTVDFTNDKVRAVSQDGGNGREWEDDWLLENVPSTNRDDITDATPLGIPEFSSLIMPISSVILIVGYNHRLKRKYSQQH
ncbi:MAG: hypothetical protein QGF98_00005, partial [Candidatus Poseidoniia archaeon]|nr:hypothetical protein [Candidatus Poseidoniia archaeon]